MGASLRLYLSREARRGVPRGYDADRPRAPAPAPRNEPRKRRRCGGERRARHRSRGACRPAPLPVRLRLRACAQARLPSAPVARAARATRPATTVGGSAGRTPAANESPTGARCPWRVSQRRAGGARCLARHLGRAPRRAAPRRAAPPASPAPWSGVHPPSLTARSSAAAGGRPLEERCRRARARGYFWKFQSLIISHQALQVQLGPVPPPPARTELLPLPTPQGGGARRQPRRRGQRDAAPRDREGIRHSLSLSRGRGASVAQGRPFLSIRLSPPQAGRQASKGQTDTCALQPPPQGGTPRPAPARVFPPPCRRSSRWRPSRAAPAQRCAAPSLLLRPRCRCGGQGRRGPRGARQRQRHGTRAPRLGRAARPGPTLHLGRGDTRRDRAHAQRSALRRGGRCLLGCSGARQQQGEKKSARSAARPSRRAAAALGGPATCLF